MRPFWTEAREILAAALARHPRWLVASDFDGTLSPIVAHPEDAVLPERARCALVRLRSLARASVALVSGRALSDLPARVGLEGLSYAGNHGLELSTPSWSWQHPGAVAARAAVATAARALNRSLSEIPGAQVEEKGLSLTVHFRRASAARVAQVLRAVEAQAVLAPSLRLHAGKAVVELRPRMDWHKGSALLLLAERAELPASAVIYLGDDVTDEDAFRALAPHDALTVHVGSGPTAARWQAEDPAEACAILEFLADQLQGPAVDLSSKSC